MNKFRNAIRPQVPVSRDIPDVSDLGFISDRGGLVLGQVGQHDTRSLSRIDLGS